MKPLALGAILGLALLLIWFRLFAQRERLWTHSFAADWNAPGMDAYDEPEDDVQPPDPWPVDWLQASGVCRFHGPFRGPICPIPAPR
ncbi:MAG: hypothetical protein V1912_11320 [bacterium]